LLLRVCYVLLLLLLLLPHHTTTTTTGVYSQDLRELYDLKDPEWKFDIVPEVWEGHNIMDFVDPDIDAKLAQLEQEEEEEEVSSSSRKCNA
jgi:hypothetical protein